MRKQFDAREPSELDARLDECFAAYRDACPDPEPAADFMPRLWARIEGRRESQAAAAWRRWTEAFLSLAAAACLAIVLLQVVPQTAPVYYHSTYLDQLSEEAGPEHMLLQDVAQAEAPRPLPPNPANGVQGR
jgi:ferric-dicitrate binding protein FerR (iron transport regulator)